MQTQTNKTQPKPNQNEVCCKYFLLNSNVFQYLTAFSFYLDLCHSLPRPCCRRPGPADCPSLFWLLWRLLRCPNRYLWLLFGIPILWFCHQLWLPCLWLLFSPPQKVNQSQFAFTRSHQLKHTIPKMYF